MNRNKIYSFHYSPEQWIELKGEQRKHEFKMPCCGEQAVLKTSSLGTQFFAHKTKSNNCPVTANETKEHLFAKYSVSRTLYEMGWRVETEKHGVTSNGKEWIADIYAEKGKAKMAVEIQWSPQTYETTAFRQQVYNDAGIRCVWLLRDSKISNSNALTGDFRFRTHNIPAFTLVKRKDGSMRVHNMYMLNNNANDLKSKFQPVSLELKVFINELFSGNLSFIERQTDDNQFMSLELINDNCWNCHQDIVYVGRVCYHKNLYGVITREWGSRNIRQIPQIHVDFINQYFQPLFQFARLSKRYSKTDNSSYIANSCSHCNALMGKHFEENLYYRFDTTETPICNLPCGTIENHAIMKVGQWIINPTSQSEIENDPLNYFQDFDPTERPTQDYSDDNANNLELENDYGMVEITFPKSDRDVKNIIDTLVGRNRFY